MKNNIAIVADGTIGDILPFALVGRELLNLGYHVSFGTHPEHMSALAPFGFELVAIYPEQRQMALDIGISHDEFVRNLMHPALAVPFAIKHVVIRYHDFTRSVLLKLMRHANAALIHAPGFVARDVARGLSVPCFYGLLSPACRLIGPTNSLIEYASDILLHQKNNSVSPQFFSRSKKSPRGITLGTLGLYPRLFSRRKDTETFVAGYCELDRDENPYAPPTPSLSSFMHNGPSPVVVTCGSIGGQFYHGLFTSAVISIKNLGLRAVLIDPPEEIVQANLGNKDVFIAQKSDYYSVFSLASLVIHHGGMGTVCATLRTGIPQLIVPSCRDQFWNGRAVERLGLGLCASDTTIHTGLRRLLTDELVRCTRRALQASKSVRSDQGRQRAAEMIQSAMTYM